MKTQPLRPAAIEFNAEGTPFAADYGDIYHPRAGALQQARHVFIAGNQLPDRWQGRAQFTILETGFGLGNNFLATWDAWRIDPRRCGRLSFVSVEARPPAIDVLQRVHRSSPLADLAAALIAAWPLSTSNLHRLTFEGGRVELLLAFGDLQAWLPELVIDVDAFFLDGFAPARNPEMWDSRVCRALGRRAAPGATLATWTAAQAVRTSLRSAGFEVRLGAGTGGKRDITLARFAPVFLPQRPPGRQPSRPVDSGRVGIVGGGLAGCATAWALAERGRDSTLFERQPAVCQEASGNPAGVFHGVVHGDDGVHARFHRAAALALRPVVRMAVDAHAVSGNADGLLRLEGVLSHPEMQALLLRLGLPTGYVEALDADAGSRASGLPLQLPAWHYPGGGWVHPAGLARSLIERTNGRAEARCNTHVQRILRKSGRWQLLDAAGRVLDTADTLVLANAGDALRLLGEPAWGLQALRGQLSYLAISAAPPALAACRLPVTGSGYLLPEASGCLIFGATSQPFDADPTVRRSDHDTNLRQLLRLTPAAHGIDPAGLQGRTAWRWSTADRLPIVGAVPELALLRGERPALPRWDQPRFVPREPGLHVFTGLGSRGISGSVLCAQALAATICGTPLPLEAELIDAIDPARFVSRARRRSRAG